MVYSLGNKTKYQDGKHISGKIAGELYKMLDEIRWREHASFNAILNRALMDFAKRHYKGNEAFTLEPFIENPMFVADPAIRETNERWEKYLQEHCSEKELAQFQSIFKTRYNQAVKHWKKKKGF